MSLQRAKRTNMGRRKDKTFIYYDEDLLPEDSSSEEDDNLPQPKSIPNRKAKSSLLAEMRHNLYAVDGISSGSEDDADSSSEEKPRRKKQAVLKAVLVPPVPVPAETKTVHSETETEDEDNDVQEPQNVRDSYTEGVSGDSDEQTYTAPSDEQSEGDLQNADVEMAADHLDLKWERKFKELVEFVARNKTFIVGKGPLESWVHRQRVEYKAKKLAPHRLQKLEAIGFPWNPKLDNWHTRYYDLKSYLETKKVVPHTHPLAKWETKQREMHQQRALKQDKAELLNLIGFNWEEPNVNTTPPRSKRDPDTAAKTATPLIDQQHTNGIAPLSQRAHPEPNRNTSPVQPVTKSSGANPNELADSFKAGAFLPAYVAMLLRTMPNILPQTPAISNAAENTTNSYTTMLPAPQSAPQSASVSPSYS